jgi:hypothetical protein
VSEDLRPDEIIMLEQKHECGYDNQQQIPEEVSEWEPEQVWNERELEERLEP